VKALTWLFCPADSLENEDNFLKSSRAGFDTSVKIKLIILYHGRNLSVNEYKEGVLMDKKRFLLNKKRPLTRAIDSFFLSASAKCFWGLANSRSTFQGILFFCDHLQNRTPSLFSQETMEKFSIWLTKNVILNF
jgi:hypothetical protein